MLNLINLNIHNEDEQVKIIAKNRNYKAFNNFCNRQ